MLYCRHFALIYLLRISLVSALVRSPKLSQVALRESIPPLQTLDRLTARIPTFSFRAYDSSESEPAESAPCSPQSPSQLSTPPPTFSTNAMDAERLQNIEEGLREQVAANRSTQQMLVC